MLTRRPGPLVRCVAQDIHVQTAGVLGNFLKEIRQADVVDFAKLTEILVKFTNSKGASPLVSRLPAAAASG